MSTKPPAEISTEPSAEISTEPSTEISTESPSTEVQEVDTEQQQREESLRTSMSMATPILKEVYP